MLVVREWKHIWVKIATNCVAYGACYLRDFGIVLEYGLVFRVMDWKVMKYLTSKALRYLEGSAECSSQLLIRRYEVMGFCWSTLSSCLFHKDWETSLRLAEK